MKILDVGAHDGFVSNWLGRQLREAGHDVTLDGIEANSHGVEVGNERHTRDGLRGTFVKGLAEHAPLHFEMGSYDAVVAYEIIEHVPDVPLFLDQLEVMLKPDGRVYLSTPEGTFGEGNNPHHLRAYRAIDLFELCRRRGTVEDMLPGSDGVNVICYTPSRIVKPEVAIYCGPGWEKWHPMDIETKGLGGSETAAIRLAEALSESYTVTVYGEVDSCAFRQVSFRHWSVYDPLEERDTVIVSRTPAAFDRPINARRKLLWMHDTDYGPEMTPERVAKMDAIMVLSQWHSDHVREMYPFTEDKLLVTSNGIEPSYFGRDFDRKPFAVYSSSPDRGLDLMLKLWPRVREQVPDAELHYCYSSVYDKVAESNPVVGAFRERVRELADQPGVENLGSLTQPGLAKVMQYSKVWLAPSYHSPGNQPFNETYCIGAVEAAAAGCCLVVSDWGALSERVQDAVNSVVIPAPDSGEGIDEDAWVSGIVNAMTVPEYEPSLTALNTTWKRVAQDFIVVMEHGLATKL